MDDGKTVLAGMTDSIKIWDIEQAQMVDIIMKHQSQIYDMKTSDDYLFGKFKHRTNGVHKMQKKIFDLLIACYYSC